MVFYDVIDKKKNKKALSKDEIEFFIRGVTDDSIPDYQISALLMAIVLNGMNEKETFYLTDAMLHSGKLMDKGGIKGICADKHSTGGVSDSTTLVVVPVICSLGIKFAKLSGRALGHTGGTLDKLESFSGYDINLSESDFENTVNTVGAAIAGQTEETDPADKKLYALRDVTATVDSIPLIASSVMSKKLASFADIIVLDVKYGSGSFMKTKNSALLLAKTMVALGKKAKRKVSAVITSMNQPLGDKIGCNLEVTGAIEVLCGKKNDLYTVSKCLACEIMRLAGTEKNQAEKLFDEQIENGKALDKLKEIVAAQGGSVEAIEHPGCLERAKYKRDALCAESGYISSINTENLGMTNVLLGGGRIKKTDEIDHTCGIDLHVRLGDYMKKGDALATLYSSKPEVLKDACDKLSASYTISSVKPKTDKLIYKIIT